MGLLRALVGAHQRRDQRGAAAVGQPHLLAVDDVVAVVLPGGLRPDARDVGAQSGLGHGERAAHLAGGHARQEALLLLLRAVLDDHVGDDEVRVDDAGDAHPAAGDLLDHERVGQQRLTEAAVLLGDRQTEDPELLEPVDDLLRVDVAVLELLGVRDDLLVHEALDRRQDLLLDVGQVRGLREAGHRISSGTPVSLVTGQYAAPPPGFLGVSGHARSRAGRRAISTIVVEYPRIGDRWTGKDPMSTSDENLYRGDPPAAPPPAGPPPTAAPGLRPAARLRPPPGYGPPPGYPQPSGYGPPPGYGYPPVYGRPTNTMAILALVWRSSSPRPD